MECCHDDDASPECTVDGFTPGWVDASVNWLHIRVDPSQPGGTWASARSPPMTGRSERRLNNPMVILLKVSMCHMPKKRSRLSWIRRETGQQPVICLTVALVTCLVYGIRSRGLISKQVSKQVALLQNCLGATFTLLYVHLTRKYKVFAEVPNIARWYPWLRPSPRSSKQT